MNLSPIATAPSSHVVSMSTTLRMEPVKTFGDPDILRVAIEKVVSESGARVRSYEEGPITFGSPMRPDGYVHVDVKVTVVGTESAMLQAIAGLRELDTRV